MAILSISRPALACLLLWLALSQEAIPQARKGPDCKNPKTILDFIKEVKVEVEENGVKLDSNGEKIEEVKIRVEENGVRLKSNGEMIDYNANALKEVLTVVNEIRELLDSGIKGMGFYLESTYINYCYFY